MKFLIKNGLVINPTFSQKSDVLINNEIIESIDKEILPEDNHTQIIDATNKYIIPGGIDPHVHFHLKTSAGFSSDDFFSGSRAAIAGGTTTVIDFVTPERNQSLVDALQQRFKDSECSTCDYSFHVSPITFHEKLKNEMEECIHRYGIQSFKVYMAYKDTIGIDTQELEKIFELAHKLNVLITIHAENGDKIQELQKKLILNGRTEPFYHAISRPPEVEKEAVEIALKLAQKTKTSIYFVHISTAGSIQTISQAQKDGFPIFAETCPQYLLLDIEKLKAGFEKSAPYVFSPPLRESWHQDILWKHIELGNIQTIGTDHCPFLMKGQKNKGYNDFTKIANGAGGVEYRLSLLFTFGVLQKKITLEQWVSICSSNVADLFMIPNKGRVQKGYYADLVLWNPEPESTISVKNHWQKCDSNIYEGIKVKGIAEKVWLRGNLVFNNGNHSPIKGQFIKRK